MSELILPAIMVLLVLFWTWPTVSEWRRKPLDHEIRAKAPGSFIRLTDGITHYSWSGVSGSEETAVCIHGLTTPSSVWQELIPGLNTMGFRILTYDLFGRGYSDRPDTTYTPEFHLRQLEELIENQGVQGPMTLFGYSMGGYLAAIFAARHIEQVEAVILLAPAGMGKSQPGGLRRLIHLPWIGERLLLASYPLTLRRGIASERCLPEAPQYMNDLQLAEMGYRGFIPAVVSSIRHTLSGTAEREIRNLCERNIPILAIYGGKDAIIPESSRLHLASCCPGARQIVITDAGHGIPYTHASEVLEGIRNHRLSDQRS